MRRAEDSGGLRGEGSARATLAAVRLDAKTWWLTISIPTVVVSETVGIMTGVVFIGLCAARGLQHWMMMRG